MTNEYVRPQRDTVGITFPEMLIFAVLQEMAVDLKNGEYAKGHREEPIIQQFRGISETQIRGCFTSLKNNPPKVSLAFPKESHSLPWITVMPESMSEHTIILSDSADSIPYAANVSTKDVYLLPKSGVIAGETVMRFPVRNIDSGSIHDSIYLVRAGATIPLSWINNEFTIDADAGEITLALPLIAGDAVLCDSFIYYTLEGGETIIGLYTFNTVIFVDTINPLLTHFLVGLVWRTLLANRVTMQQNGLDDLRISRRSLSLWDASVPAIGYRSEILVAGKTEWSAYTRVDRPKLIYNEITDDMLPITEETAGSLLSITDESED